jgi:hypothetical protein
MRSTTSIIATVLALGVSTSAQQLMPPDPAEGAIKFQVKNFESLLRNSVVLGGQQVVERARQIVPDVMLYFVSDPSVSGWYTDTGYTFEVTVPDMAQAPLILLRKVQQTLPAPRPSPATPVANGDRTVATSIPNADTMTKSPVEPFDPSQFFSDSVRQSLIDAMVNNSGALQFKAGQTLQIVAGPGPSMVPNPLIPDSRKLIFTVKGEDLNAFHQGQMKREDLLAKIQERRF